MKPELQEINDMLASIEFYYVDLEKVFHMSDEERQEFAKMLNKTRPIYDEAMASVRKLTLSSEEILEGFEEGCKLLQMPLAGYMKAYYDPMFTDTMIKAIRDNHRAGYHFLACLCKHMKIDEVKPILLEALECTERRILETALGFTRNYKVYEALPKVRALISYPDERVSQEAEELAEMLENLKP